MMLTDKASFEGRTIIFDLDGVVYRGWEVQPTTRETLQKLNELGRKVYFFTNNSGKSRKYYSDKLKKMDIDAPISNIMTSGYATALYLKDINACGKSVYMVGGDGLFEELTAIGMKVVRGDQVEKNSYDFVIAGIDIKFNYDKLALAQYAILHGAKFIATNCDPTFPLEDNELSPGGGSLVAAIATASGTKPFVVGKPETYAFNKILEMAECKPCDAVMVGDRLDTDVVVANKAGATSVLVLTGVTTEKEAYAATGEQKPDYIINRLVELL